jgi:hypothetical protein
MTCTELPNADLGIEDLLSCHSRFWVTLALSVLASAQQPGPDTKPAATADAPSPWLLVRCFRSSPVPAPITIASWPSRRSDKSRTITRIISGAAKR